MKFPKLKLRLTRAETVAMTAVMAALVCTIAYRLSDNHKHYTEAAAEVAMMKHQADSVLAAADSLPRSTPQKIIGGQKKAKKKAASGSGETRKRNHLDEGV